MPRQYQPADEATKKRLEEMRQKGLETRRMKAQLKKAEKDEAKEALRKAYEDKVLKKQQKAEKAPIEETEKEIYERANHAEEEHETDSDDYEEEPPKPTPKPKASKSKTVKATPTPQPQDPNYKNEYYRVKLDRLRQQEEQAQFMNSYARLPPAAHAADIARQQLTNKINKEVFDRVYTDLFQC